MSAFDVGDEVEVTITGTVVELTDHNMRCCTHIRDRRGNNHWFYKSPFSDSVQVEVVKPAYKYEDGIYMDSDGQVFKHHHGDWYIFLDESKMMLSTDTESHLARVPLPYSAKPW